MSTEPKKVDLTEQEETADKEESTEKLESIDKRKPRDPELRDVATSASDDLPNLNAFVRHAPIIFGSNTSPIRTLLVLQPSENFQSGYIISDLQRLLPDKVFVVPLCQFNNWFIADSMRSAYRCRSVGLPEIVLMTVAPKVDRGLPKVTTEHETICDWAHGWASENSTVVIEDMRFVEPIEKYAQSQGGNFVVSPPIKPREQGVDVLKSARPMKRSGLSLLSGSKKAGPTKLATSKPMEAGARYGMLILGTKSKNGIHRYIRDLLKKRCVQPIIEISVEGLEVGHADEMVGFVGDGENWAMTVACEDTAFRLMTACKSSAIALSLPLQVPWKQVKGPIGKLKRTQVGTQENINKLQLRLQLAEWEEPRGSVLSRPRVVRLPVQFVRQPEGTTVRSMFVNMVNMVNDQWLCCVPRPYGPRVLESEALDVLYAAVKHILEWKTWFEESPVTGGEHVNSLKLKYFDVITTDRPDIELYEKLGIDGFTITSIVSMSLDGTTPEKKGPRQRVHTEQSTVDLFELYTLIILSWAGATVHFVDSVPMHQEGGELHCATNIIYDPHEHATFEDVTELLSKVVHDT